VTSLTARRLQDFPPMIFDRRFRLLACALALMALAPLPAMAPRGPEQGGGAAGGSRFGDSGQQRRNVAGEFDYYTLVLSWSPTHCASAQRADNDPQCNRRDGRRYAFVLHGLWPQYERGWPEYCPVRGRPFVPQPVIDSVLDIMPSPRLAIHEYKKHGTCSGLDPKGYYELSRQLFRKIRIPERYINPTESQLVAPEDLADEFLRLNKDLKPDMLSVSCGGPGNRLREVRVCFDRTGAPRACGRNEDQRKLCSASKMFVPPVRSSAPDNDGDAGRGNAPSSPLPGPRVIPAPQRAL
jgi:ribonuclease T2